MSAHSQKFGATYPTDMRQARRIISSLSKGLTIMSRDKRTYAVLVSVADGVEVQLWDSVPNNGMATLKHHAVIDMPFHVVADHTHRLIQGI